MKKRICVPALFILLSGIQIWFSSFTKQKERRETAFETTIKDSIAVRVELVYGKDDLPDYYFSQIKTPVCEDSLCYLVTIDLYWDLLGNFQNYKTPKGNPLTKFDHIRFTNADHAKMKAILANNESSLRDHAVESLVDPEKKKKSAVVVDAVSGATNTAVKDEVVEGALYSTYTLWHIVNGDIAGKIREHSRPLINETVLRKMLGSDNAHYQYYALNKIPEQDLDKFAPLLIRLVSEGSSFVPYFAIEKIPLRIWTSENFQVTLVKLIGKVEFKMQNEILNKLKDIKLKSNSLDILISYIPKLNANQRQKVGAIANSNEAALSAKAAAAVLKSNAIPNP
ncbi:hypothetical protein [Dyadobacter sp. CY323]|uniref:hypothetical protein n=1 Tax=Dyadobacter sp. CY323 TaxID=2907302 RepID=UPI001F2B31F4|nr:hypothetical protein [Dyadobacter sp. CY323]MCE6989319.1 hypothetical protein [Dyadobacter sp. CY323]